MFASNKITAVELMLLVMELHMLISITANNVKLVHKGIIIQPQSFFSDRAKGSIIVCMESDYLPGLFAASSDIPSVGLNTRATRSWQVSGWSVCSLTRG